MKFEKVAGYRLPKSGISTQSVHSADMTGKEEHVLDVRNDEEWNNGHLDQAVNIPHGKLLNENNTLIKRIKYMYIVSQVLEVQLQWVYWKAKVLKMW